MSDKRRWVEWGKDALIALLTLSAVYLLSMTPLVQDSGLLDLLHPQPAAGGASAGAIPTGTVLPARLSVGRDGSRYGLQYDEKHMEELFISLGPLLGDALAGASDPRQLPESGWRRYLQGECVYFDFSGEVPLAALCSWMGGEGACTLPGNARRLVLAAGEDDQVMLCWQEEDGFFACATSLSRSLHLAPALEGASPNGAYFAFEDDGLSLLLSPYTLITGGDKAGAQYSAASPLSGESGAQAVLDALSFNGQNHAPVSGGEVYLDGDDRLVVEEGGTVTYRAAQGEKYPVGSPGSPVTAATAAEGALALAERTVGALCGEARLYLISALPYQEGWRVRFGYRLDGGSVYLYDEGWAAEFIIREGFITDFTLHFRSYAANGGSTLLLPIDRAAVMLPDLTQGKRELVIQYRDRGGASVSPDWVAN